MLAILGGSGCGKTLLLRCLAGRPFDEGQFRATGRVSLNWGLFYRSGGWHRKIGFVQRTDELYPKLTVRETVLFAGRLKSGRDDFGVDGWLAVWGLERVAGRLVEEIESEMMSIGNRKRVAIAIHTVHRPDVLFLDEPTLGLDPRREEQLIRDIHGFAQRFGVAVVMTINPSRSAVFRYFSRCMVLCHGQTVFFGTLSQALEYFERTTGRPNRAHQSPSEYLTSLVTLEDSGASLEEQHQLLDELRSQLAGNWSRWRHLFIRSETVSWWPRQIPNAKTHTWPNSWWKEVKILLRREFIELSRDYPPIIYNILQRLLVFTLLSFLYFQVGNYPLPYAFRVRFGLLIFLPVNQATLVLALIVPSIAYVRPMIVRERLSLTYRTSSIYCARVLSEFPVNFASTIVYAFIIYYVCGLRPGFTHFLIFLGTLLLEVYCVLGLGFAVSCLATNRRLRDLLTMLIFLTMFMFGGYQIQNRLNVTWILLWMQYLSPIFYTYVAFIRNEFEGQVIEGARGTDVLIEYRGMPISIWAAMGALLGLGTCYFMVGYVALRRTTRLKRFIF